MTKTERMRCLKCGAEMNHHADKIDYTSGAAEPAWHGVLQQVHQCPTCGNIELRRPPFSG
jgi:ribosomal protein S27AE